MGPDETASLPRPKCSNCDTIGVPGARFCSHCGTRLDESAGADSTMSFSETGADEGLTGPNPVVATLPPEATALVVRKGPDTGTQYLLHKDVMSVGRSPDSDIFLDDFTVSRNHAELLHSTSGWLLHDKRSLNGTYVNGRLIEDEQRLGQGDHVQIGKFHFVFLGAE